MKVLFFLAFSPLALAFTPSSRQQSLVSPLQAVSPFPDNDWIGKPIPRKGDRATPAVAEKKVTWLEKQTMEDVMLDPDYFLAASTFLLGPLIMWYHPSYAEVGPSLIGVCGGLFHMLFAALLFVQTRRVRCVFHKDAFEFYNIKGPELDLDKGAYLERKPDNYVSKTQNRWSYDTIINYGFFPSIEYPVICYFKETETPKYKWNRWLAAFDSYGLGQPHFFPGICNARQFREQMEKRGVKHKPIPSLKDTQDK